MTTFAFVHGSWHHGGVFDSVRGVLDREGHESVAPSLPITDPAAGLAEYADAIDGGIPQTDDLVVVGHSAGGLTASLVAARRNPRRLVYLAAFVPLPGRPILDDFQAEPVPLTPEGRLGRMTDRLGRTYWPDEDRARELLYGECDALTASEAFARLRPQGQLPMSQPSPLDRPLSLPTTYVLCRRDRMISARWSREVAVPRAGADLVEMSGDHSPMHSRPNELAALLLSLED